MKKNSRAYRERLKDTVLWQKNLQNQGNRQEIVAGALGQIRERGKSHQEKTKNGQNGSKNQQKKANGAPSPVAQHPENSVKPATPYVDPEKTHKTNLFGGRGITKMIEPPPPVRFGKGVTFYYPKNSVEEPPKQKEEKPSFWSIARFLQFFRLGR